MRFIVSAGWAPYFGQDIILLQYDNWDDFGYKTTFSASYFDSQGEEHNLGTVKIAKTQMNDSLTTASYLKDNFDSLPEGFFSLWQTAEAYKRVLQCEKEYNLDILKALNDIALDPDLYEKYKDENILNSSLFRFVSFSLYKRQFRRIVRGEAVLTPYDFSYIIKSNNPFIDDCILNFSVTPETLPPTNVHAIIGNNGIGKTTLIKHMINSICNNITEYGMFRYNDQQMFSTEESEIGNFENIICISFNPFDDYSEIENCSVYFKYIGIRKEYSSEGYEDGYGEINLLDDISKNFRESLHNCLGDVTKKDDLVDVLSMLETECNFLSSNYDFTIDINNLSKDNLSPAEKAFNQLSAGHKVVLSIIIRFIDVLVEKSVVFIDEPENHLHPPLLSSLIRGISSMMKKRNGVAIISTHSPIVLQEIPRSCVWILNRVGNTVNARRPEIETFGTNIGVLTNEIFGFEVQRTGFIALLKNAVDKYNNYERVLEEFNNQLGEEAKSIIRIMLKQKEIR